MNDLGSEESKLNAWMLRLRILNRPVVDQFGHVHLSRQEALPRYHKRK